jgi:LmbE family N-acetylglucosaminyl deacetylase
MITTSAGVAALGTILGIWAHPDDEAYLSGGLMTLAREQGARVVCVTATRGERGTPDPVAWPPNRLAAARTAEMSHCLDILGVREHHWLDHPDGGCADADPAAAIDSLSELIDRVRPDTVLTFGPDGYTGHLDHRTIGGWAAAAVDALDRPRIRVLRAAIPRRRHQRWADLNRELGVFEPGYPVVVPDLQLAVHLVLEPRIAARKVRALAAQHTQTAGLMATLGLERYTAWVGEECFVERPDLLPDALGVGEVPVDRRPGDHQQFVPADRGRRGLAGAAG